MTIQEPAKVSTLCSLKFAKHFAFVEEIQVTKFQNDIDIQNLLLEVGFIANSKPDTQHLHLGEKEVWLLCKQVSDLGVSHWYWF